MKVVGYVSVGLVALVLAAMTAWLASMAPEFQRYMKIKSM